MISLNRILKEVLEEDYPSFWNWDYFKEQRTFADRKRYCDKNLKFLISGSGRLVYQIDNEKVLKLAKNRKGVAQCEVEIDLGDDSYINNIVAPTFEHNDDGLWVEMAIATKLTKGKFKSLMGYSFDDFAQQLTYFYYRNMLDSNYTQKIGYKVSPVDNEEIRNKIEEDDFYNGVCDLMSSYDMPVGDLKKLNSYGVIKEDGVERVAVIDYGLTNSVYDHYYS